MESLDKEHEDTVPLWIPRAAEEEEEAAGRMITRLVGMAKMEQLTRIQAQTWFTVTGVEDPVSTPTNSLWEGLETEESGVGGSSTKCSHVRGATDYPEQEQGEQGDQTMAAWMEEPVDQG